MNNLSAHQNMLVTFEPESIFQFFCTEMLTQIVLFNIYSQLKMIKALYDKILEQY